MTSDPTLIPHERRRIWDGPERRAPFGHRPQPPVVSIESTPPAELGYGFGGAPIAMLDSIAETSQPGDLVFFGINHQLGRRFGQRNPGAASFVRNATAAMMPWTRAHGARCHDIGILSEARPGLAIKEAISISAFLAGIGRRPCLVGCDHTASLANTVGVAHAAAQPLTYLYLDAHFDLGLHGHEHDLHNGNFISALLHTDKISQVINIGGRSWSTFDPIYQSVEHFSFIRFATAEAVIAQLAPLRSTTLYVSLDADVLDPAFAPNLPCPEPFGITSSDLLSLCTWLGQNCVIAGADMCEIMPSDRSLCSEQVVMRSLMALFPSA